MKAMNKNLDKKGLRLGRKLVQPVVTSAYSFRCGFRFHHRSKSKHQASQIRRRKRSELHVSWHIFHRAVKISAIANDFSIFYVSLPFTGYTAIHFQKSNGNVTDNARIKTRKIHFRRVGEDPLLATDIRFTSEKQ